MTVEGHGSVRETSSRKKTWLGMGLRLLVSAALLIWLVKNFQGGLARLEEVHLRRLAPAVLVFIVSTILGALQWGLLLRQAGIELSLRRLARLYWIGLFFNNFLPSNVGGDLVKVADVSLSTGEVARAVAGTVLDRLFGLTALAGLGLIAAVVLGGSHPAGLSVFWLILVTLGLLILVSALLSARLGRFVVRLLRPLKVGRLGERAASLWTEFEKFRNSPLFLVSIFSLALTVQALRVLTHIMVALALDIPMDLELVLGLYVLIPVLGVAIVLPVSFNGLGLREFIATRLLPAIGIAAPEAFALQITTYLVQVGVSALGGLFFAGRLLWGRRDSGRPQGTLRS